MVTSLNIKGQQSSEGVYFNRPDFQFITFEVDGITYNRKWDSNTIMEPWLIDPLLKEYGYPDDMPYEMVKNFCLKLIIQFDVDPITKGELENILAGVNQGWDLHKEFINQ